MHQRTVIRGNRIVTDVPCRDPDAFFSLVGTDGGGKKAFLPVGDALLSRHLLLLGGLGTGKTNLLRHLVRNLRVNLSENDTLVVFGAEGEYGSPLRQPGDAVFTDRTTESDENAAWNLFSELETGDRLAEDTAVLCRTLFAARTEDTPYAVSVARDLMQALILYLCRQEDPALRNNRMLRALVEGFDGESMRVILQSLPEFRTAGAYLLNPKDDRTSEAVAILQRAARELLQVRFGTVGKLGMRPTMRQGKAQTIFVDYDPEHGGSTGPAYAAILEQCLAETLSRTERKGSVYLLADNLCALPKMGLLKEALLFGREKGLHVIASLTDASTPEALYGEADAYAILNAFGTVAAFRLQDEASRAFVQSRYGSQRVTESNVPQQGQGQQRGGVEQVSDQPVIGDDDLTGLQTGQSVVCSLHYPPFLFRVRLFGANPENA